MCLFCDMTSHLLDFYLKGIVPHCSKPVWIFFFCWTQKKNWCTESENLIHPDMGGPNAIMAAVGRGEGVNSRSWWRKRVRVWEWGIDDNDSGIKECYFPLGLAVLENDGWCPFLIMNSTGWSPVGVGAPTFVHDNKRSAWRQWPMGQAY